MLDLEHEVRRRLEEVLAVVEHEQQLLPREEVREHVDGGNRSVGLETEACRDHVGDGVGLASAGQLAPPRAVGKLGRRVHSGLHRQPRLSDAADAGEHDHPMIRERFRDESELAFAPEKRGDRYRQVARQLL